MIDLHSHILPGLDDGAGSAEAALELARAAVADGVRAIAGTPHVRNDYPTLPEQMEQGVASMREAFHEASVPLELLPGGEIALDRLPELEDADLCRFGLGGNPRLLLLEFPYFGLPLGLPSIVSRLRASGFVPVLAHPERNVEVQERPDRLGPLVADGAVVQLTASSIDGSAGKAVSRCAGTLLDRGLAHLIASDWHGGAIRRSGLASARRAIADEALADWLTETVPAALLAGTPLPPRPGRRRRRSWPFG